MNDFIINLFIIAILALPVLFVLLLIFRIIYGLVKNKRKTAIICAVILGSFVLLIVGFMFLFPTEFPYVDRILYGKTKEEVIDIYGEPELNGKERIGYYIGIDNKGIDPSHVEMYYYVCFDENGFVHEIYSGLHPGG